MNLLFNVSCGHRDPRWQRTNLPVTVSVDRQGEGNPDRYYVSMSGFGCSKSYSTPRNAIIGMLQDHACFDIHVEDVEPVDIVAEARKRGQMDRLDGHPANYGCHCGMRSTRDACVASYTAGWDEIDAALGAEPGVIALLARLAEPRELNGYPVIKRRHHNHCTTVMVDRHGDYDQQRYVVATWAPMLRSTWSWGHYWDDRFDADRSFEEVAARNERRGA
jgi:hypothetical protein